jgi:uncharacterized protein YxeA
MKKVLYGIIAILLAVVIFFMGALVNQNTQNSLIKQTEEVAKQTTETSSSTSYITTEDHLKEMTETGGNTGNTYTKVLKVAVYGGRQGYASADAVVQIAITCTSEGVFSCALNSFYCDDYQSTSIRLREDPCFVD